MDFKSLASHELEMMAVSCMTRLLLAHTFSLLKINLPYLRDSVILVPIICTIWLDKQFESSSPTPITISQNLTSFFINLVFLAITGFILLLPFILRFIGVGVQVAQELLANNNEPHAAHINLVTEALVVAWFILTLVFVPSCIRSLWCFVRLMLSIIYHVF